MNTGYSVLDNSSIEIFLSDESTPCLLGRQLNLTRTFMIQKKMKQSDLCS